MTTRYEDFGHEYQQSMSLPTPPTTSAGGNANNDRVADDHFDGDGLHRMESNTSLFSERIEIQQPEPAHLQDSRSEEVTFGDIVEGESGYDGRLNSTTLTSTPFSPTLYREPPYLNEKDPETVGSEKVEKKKKRICGMGHRMFWGMFVLGILVLVSVAIGAIFATRVKKHHPDENRVPDPFEKYSSTVYMPNPTFTPAPLEIGPWDINKRVDIEEGICGTHPQAVFACVDPLELKFNILQTPGGYRAEQEAGSLLNKPFRPPQDSDELWSINVFDDQYPVYLLDGRQCRTTANATVMVGPNYEYHVIFHYMNPKECKVGNGFVAEAGQFCHCEWKGHIYGKDEVKPSSTVSSQTLQEPLTTMEPKASNFASETNLLPTSTMDFSTGTDNTFKQAKFTNGPSPLDGQASTSTFTNYVTITVSTTPFPTQAE
ncbi:hypothetical protein DFH27DRAFT_176625 [Peziza echinospora]|nr:hypothetical protein DFH27DRAFT_176625 [Peziza echinospora]